MSVAERAEEAIRRAMHHLPATVQAELVAIFTPTNIAIAAGTIAAWAGSHAFGVGFVVDAILVVVGGIALGWAVFELAACLYAFADLVYNATSWIELEAAGIELADAIAIAGIGTVAAVVTRGAARAVTPARRSSRDPIPQGFHAEWQAASATAAAARTAAAKSASARLDPVLESLLRTLRSKHDAFRIPPGTNKRGLLDYLRLHVDHVEFAVVRSSDDFLYVIRGDKDGVSFLVNGAPPKRVLFHVHPESRVGILSGYAEATHPGRFNWEGDLGKFRLYDLRQRSTIVGTPYGTYRNRLPKWDELDGHWVQWDFNAPQPMLGGEPVIIGGRGVVD